MAQTLPPTAQSIEKVVSFLTQGNIVAVPTETVYGLAGNAFDPKAIATIYSAKGRPDNNPLIVHVRSWEQLEEIAQITPKAKLLSEQFWPGPLSLILKKKDCIPDSVTAGMPTVAVRMPSHPVFRQLANNCPFPLAAPSANPFGYISPTSAQHVEQCLGNKIDLILDGGSSEAGIESTILSLADESKPSLLRLGVITREQLEDCLGESVEFSQRIESTANSLESPGLLSQHYSPTTPLTLFSGKAPNNTKANEAVVLLAQPSLVDNNTFHLSEKGKLEDIARNLYGMLHDLDQREFNKIHMECPQGDGIASAITDRMSRAATQG